MNVRQLLASVMCDFHSATFLTVPREARVILSCSGKGNKGSDSML